MTALRLGSMCTGYAGLDQAVAQVLDVEPAWVADPDPGAAAILAHHYPDVRNLGDITAVAWSTVTPVDVVAAGFPCQDLSYAGRGAGIKEGTRSGLWYTIADAVRVLRPRLLVLENVRAIVSRRPGLDVVLGDLARLGFDAEWTCLPASAVGAPHPRWRWICLAWPADAGRPGLEGRRLRGAAPERGRAAAHPADLGHERGRLARGRRPGPTNGGLAAADARRDRRHEGRAEPAGLVGGSDAALGGHATEWGDYEPAIRRWEHVLGRPAPRPVEPGRTGDRLSPRFVEWLMGLDEGHVTAVPGLTRNQQLHALGNGVVPQQGAASIEHLLDRMDVAA